MFIDGGTSNTRFTLMDENHVIAREKRKVGASNGTQEGNPILLKTVRQMTDWFEQKYECQISDVFASGMITCEKGLYELPHIEAPVSVSDLAAHVARTKLPQISDHFDFYFVPGIKFMDQKELGADMMRGEETEIMGAIDSDDSNSKVLILHFGSHNKLICINEGKVSKAVTTIAGELISAVCRDTILKDTLGELNKEMNLDAEFIKKGFMETQRFGISRSIFLIRVHAVIEQEQRLQSLSYLYGAVLAIDMAAFQGLLRQDVNQIVLYGRQEFIQAFEACKLYIFGDRVIPEVKKISYADSEMLSIQGIGKIRNQYFRMHNDI